MPWVVAKLVARDISMGSKSSLAAEAASAAPLPELAEVPEPQPANSVKDIIKTRMSARFFLIFTAIFPFHFY